MVIWAITGVVRFLSFIFIVPIDSLHTLVCGLFACHHIVLRVFTSATVLCEIVSTVVTENLPKLQRRD